MGLAWSNTTKSSADATLTRMPTPTSSERILHLLYERSSRNRQDATSPNREQQSCLQQRRIDQRKSHHVSPWDQRLARTAALEADAAIHMGESLHRFDRV